MVITHGIIKQTFVGVAKIKENAPAASSANPRFHTPNFETVLTSRADKFAILYSSRDRPSNYNYFCIYNYKSRKAYTHSIYAFM